ncbi:MAG: ABC transporter permease [Prevotella sp.]|nr:ABC transporter permease [Prevotella sp.]
MNYTIGIILTLLLLAIPGAVLWFTDKALMHKLAEKLVGMTARLVALTALLWVLYYYDRWWLNLIGLAGLAVWSAVVVVRRVDLPMRQQLPFVAVSLFLSSLIVGLWVLVAWLPASNIFFACWLVPTMAVLMGHCMTTSIRGLSAFYRARRTDSLQYEYLVGNGASRLQALLPFVRIALQQVLAPTLSNIAVLGMYTLPLLMAGLLLGGFAPINAALLFVSLVLGCLAASVLSLLFTLWLANRRPEKFTAVNTNTVENP